MNQGTDADLVTYVGKITSGLLHVIDYPPGLENTFLKITDRFNATSGPFAIIENEGRNTTEFYANCYNNVRMAIVATWYNWQTFENLCKEQEERVAEATKTHPIKSQLQMSIGSSAQKLCFEYEHFMFHQKMTADRIAFFLSSFFREEQGNIFKLHNHVFKQYANRPNHPKRPYAQAINSVVNRHEGFLSLIHSSEQGRGKTERDILSHMSFIPFVNPYVQITPPGKVSVVFEATLDGKRIAPESARAILLQRYNQIAEFTKDMLDAFFDA